MRKFILASITFLALLIINACSSDDDVEGINEMVDNKTYLINISESTLDFGDISTASTGIKKFTINNTGTGIITISGITSNGSFTVIPTIASIPPDTNANFSITFSPSAIQNYSQSITVASNATNDTGAISIKGHGIDPFYLSTIAPIIMQNCSISGCHNAASRASGIAMTDFLEIKDVFENDNAWEEIVAGRMPRGGSLTQIQKDALLKWIDSNYTDGRDPLVAKNYVNDIAPIINQSCATTNCHSSFRTRAGLDLSTFALTKKAFQGNAWTRVNDGTMPLSGKLAQTKINLIKNWIDTGFTEQ
tara:strand:- start:14027 stop:14941 length:915 start_codon:yes stop_codon:yes gene_type:complete